MVNRLLITTKNLLGIVFKKKTFFSHNGEAIKEKRFLGTIRIVMYMSYPRRSRNKHYALRSIFLYVFTTQVNVTYAKMSF